PQFILKVALRGCLRTPRVRLASAGSSGARTQGGGNSSAIAPTEDTAPRRSAAVRRARGVLRQPLRPNARERLERAAATGVARGRGHDRELCDAGVAELAGTRPYLGLAADEADRSRQARRHVLQQFAGRRSSTRPLDQLLETGSREHLSVAGRRQVGDRAPAELRD